MNAIGLNPLLPVAKLADQVARPIVNTKMTDEDWAFMSKVMWLKGERPPRRLGIPAPVSDEQWDRDAAVDSREWCGND